MGVKRCESWSYQLDASNTLVEIMAQGQFENLRTVFIDWVIWIFEVRDGGTLTWLDPPLLSPFRSTVLLMPTSSCLVSLIERPPFVITLDEVEFVQFERVSLSIRTFDMVFIFKDYRIKPAMINSVPSNALDHVKEWVMWVILLDCLLLVAASIFSKKSRFPDGSFLTIR